MKKINDYSFIATWSISITCLLITWFVYQYYKNEYNATKNHEQMLLVLNEVIVYVQDNNTAEVAVLLDRHGYYQISQMPSHFTLINSFHGKKFEFKLFETKDSDGFYLEIAGKKLSAIKGKQRPLNFYIIPCLFWFFLILTGTMFYHFRRLKTQYALLYGAIRGFVKGDFTIDSKIASMCKRELQKISDLIKSRELILRSTGHEIRTPIAKMKLLMGLPTSQVPDKDYLDSLQRYITQLHVISENMLEFERAISSHTPLHYKKFSSETLLIESLKKFDDEKTSIHLEVNTIFHIRGDLPMLSVALGNLIRNALKYSISTRINIEVRQQQITIQNIAYPLRHDIDFYLQPFSRDNSHIQIDGYGLGLYIVSEIFKLHNITLSYRFEPISFEDNVNIPINFSFSGIRARSENNLGIHSFNMIF